MKVSELKDENLDYWVAKAEGMSHPPMLQEMRPGCCLVKEQKEDEPNVSYYKAFQPSTDWSQGGQIIERDRITLEPSNDKWYACYGPRHTDPIWVWVDGESALIAAMRAYVTAKFGENVDDSQTHILES